MYFYPLGNVAFSVLAELAQTRFAERERALVKGSSCGEIEGVAWLRATDQPRRIDASLLTENYARNWSVREEGEERSRQAHLLERARRQVPRGRTGLLS